MYKKNIVLRFLIAMLLFFLVFPITGWADISGSTYIGGDGWEIAFDTAIDHQGNVIVVGVTQSQNFPTTTGAYDPNGHPDQYGFNPGFISKFSPDLKNLIASTFLGKDIEIRAVTFDATGNVYIAGLCYGPGGTYVPVTNQAYDHDAVSVDYSPGGFICKISPDLSQVFACTYLGRNVHIAYTSLAIDYDGNVVVAGTLSDVSTDYVIPVTGFDNSYNGHDDIYVAKLDSNLSQLIAATFLGGRGDDRLGGIAVDENGNIYISGTTNSLDFPITNNAYDTTKTNEEDCDGFVVKLNSDLSQVLASTFLGGNDDDDISNIALSNHGVYVAGTTHSPDFPVTENVLQSQLKGGSDGFVSLFDSNLSRLLASSYVSKEEESYPDIFNGVTTIVDITVDANGFLYVTGDPFMEGAEQVFVGKISPNLDQMVSNVEFGGSSSDTSHAIVISPQTGKVYVVGDTYSTDFPTTNGAYDRTFNGSLYMNDAFVSAISLPVIDSFTAEPTYGVIPLEVTFTCTAHDPDGTISEYQWDFDGDGNIDATTTNGTVTHTYDTVGSYDATCTAVDNAGASAISSPVNILAGDHYRELNNFKIYWYHPDGNYDVVSAVVLYMRGYLLSESNNIGLPINDIFVPFSDDQQYFLPWSTIPFDITGNNSDLDPGLGGQYGYFSDPREAYVLSDEVVLNGDVIERTITRIFGSIWEVPNQPPVIDSFAVEPGTGTAPLTVAVICQAEDSDGTVTTYEFNPGDGSNPLTSSDGTFSYIYETPGTYQATCTAYDDQGASVTSEPVTVTVEEAASSWQDITEMIQVRRSRTLFDRINRCFFVHLDLTNIYNEDITGPVRMVLENNNIPIEEDGPGLDPDGYTDDDHPYFIIVPAGETWQAGETLNDLRLDFMLQRTRLNFDLRFEALEQPM